jgi:hypothetical protein
VVREVARRGHSDRGGGQEGSGVDPMAEEEEWRRRLRSVVVVVEPSPYTGVAAIAGRTGSRRCGPDGGGDDWADGEVAMWAW